MTETHKYLSAGRTALHVLSFISVLLAAFALNFPLYYLNLFFFIWIALNSVEIIFRGKYHFEPFNKKNAFLYFLVAFYLWMVISLIWTSNFDEGFKLLERRLPFLLFPLFALFGFNKFYKVKYILLTFIAGSICSVVVFIVFCYVRYIQEPGTFENLTKFTEYTFTFYKHRTYFGMGLIFSLVFYAYLQKYIISKTSPVFYYTVFFLLFILFFFVIYFSQSRMALIIFLVISIFIGGVFLVQKGYKKLFVVFLLIVVGLSFVLVKNQQRMQEFELSREKLQQFDPRYELWRNSIQCIEASNKIVGVGIGDCEDVFEANHQKPEFQQYFFPASNAHNEFLKTQLELGIIGNLLLIAILLSIVIYSRSARMTFLSVAIAIIWFLFMLVETIGITSTTTYMFAFSLLLLYMVRSEEDETDKEKTKEVSS